MSKMHLLLFLLTAATATKQQTAVPAMYPKFDGSL
jgi:hypothetical protein